MKLFTVIFFPVLALSTQPVPPANSVNLEKKPSRGAAEEDFEKLVILTLVIFIQLC
ncbi:hypothetical protein FOXYSP1_06499 [Fusarium oxysporum f. sp. phaseoli]